MDNADGGKLKLEVANLTNPNASIQRFFYFHILTLGAASTADGDYTDIGNRT